MVNISQGIILFKDSEFKTNSYLIIDPDSKMVIIDPSLKNAQDILKPLIGNINDDFNQIEAIFLTSDELYDLDGINYIAEYFPNVKIYVEKHGLENIIERAETYNNIKEKNIVEMPDRIQIGSIILNVLKTPGLNKSSVTIRYKEIAFTGYTLMSEGIYDLTISDVDKEEWLISLEKIKSVLTENYMICPIEGSIQKFDWILKNNEKLNTFLKKEA